MRRIETGYVHRPQFKPFHLRKQRFYAMCCHRRAGKTVAVVNDLIDSALRCDKPDPRFGLGYPFRDQGKEAAWGYLKRYGLQVPGASANETDLRVDFKSNGSFVRIYGLDNFEARRGGYFDGFAVDEYGDVNPNVFPTVIRPMLADRVGWAALFGTSKGRNHFADVMERAQSSDEWGHMILRASESGILPAAELASLRADMSEEQYASEFECSFEGSVVGAYWGREMQAAELAGRIGNVPYQSEIGVETWWDLGVGDANAIWFTQSVGREVHVIDYYENSGEGVQHYAKVLQDRGYVYTKHHAPHDIMVREWGNEARTRFETAARLGIKFEIVPDVGLQDGIDAARSFIARCWFDRKKTEQGRNALTNYRKTWDNKRKVFSNSPFHDWASNGADSFRYLSVGHKIATQRVTTTARRSLQTAGSGSTAWMAG
jgi:hypothetical protein